MVCNSFFEVVPGSVYDGPCLRRCNASYLYFERHDTADAGDGGRLNSLAAWMKVLSTPNPKGMETTVHIDRIATSRAFLCCIYVDAFARVCKCLQCGEGLCWFLLARADPEPFSDRSHRQIGDQA